MARFKIDRTKLGPAGYVVFFVLCFILFAYWTFPYERLRDFLAQELGRRWRAPTPGAPAPELTIGAIGPAWLFGFELTDLHVDQPPLQEGRLPIAFVIDELELHPSLLSLVTGNPRVAFEATVGEGTLEGTFVGRGKEGWALDAELDAFDLGRLGIGGTLGVPVAGKATGRIEIEAGERATEDDGEVRVRIENLVLGDGKSKVPIPGMQTGLTVEPLAAGTLVVEIAIRQGVGTIERFEADGKDLQLKASGALRPVRPLERVRLDVTLELAFGDAYKKRNDRTRALFDLLGTQPLLKRSTTADGRIRMRVSGAPQSLRARPAGSARAAAPAAAQEEEKEP